MMKREDDTIININLENHANHIYELWDEYGDDIVIETTKPTNKFVVFFNRVSKFFINLFCKCLIKRM